MQIIQVSRNDNLNADMQASNKLLLCFKSMAWVHNEGILLKESIALSILVDAGLQREPATADQPQGRLHDFNSVGHSQLYQKRNQQEAQGVSIR